MIHRILLKIHDHFRMLSLISMITFQSNTSQVPMLSLISMITFQSNTSQVPSILDDDNYLFEKRGR
jgi:hypothetical protein